MLEATRDNVLTELDLVALLSEIRGARAIGLTVETDARLRKTGNPYGPVTKVSRVNVQVNFHYDANVLKRLAAEGKDADEFKKGTSWHAPVLTEDGKLTPFCQNPKTGELYLRVQLLGRGETRYFTAEGTEVYEGELEPWLPKESAYANQGCDNPLEFRVYKLSGILEVRVGGDQYTVVNGI